MKRKDIKELIRYIFIGALTTLVSLVSYYIFKEYVFNESSQTAIQICTIISWILTVTFAYITNRIFVFRSKNKQILKEALKFYFTRISTLVIDSLSMFLLTSIIKIDDKIAKLIVQIIILILNYLFSKFAVFNKKD